MKIAIIGAGIGGIATAIRLAVKGYQVEVFEANAYPGGKLSEFEKDGFRFDAGPSLFTLPHLVTELFELAGENPGDHFNFDCLKINCQYFYPDGTEITAFANHEQLIQEITSKTAEKAENIKRAIEKSAFLYNRLGDLFMFRSLQDPKTYLSKSAVKAYKSLFKLGFFQTMNGANESRFDDPKSVQLFNRYATYNGSSPYKTPATMNIIPHLEMSLGAYFPKGGMFQITQSLVELAKRVGVKFSFNQKVEEISIHKKQVSGIILNGEKKAFDRVVSNMDIVNTYRKLLPAVKPPNFLLKQPKSSSALIFYWGIEGKFDQLDLHNILFSDNYRQEFDYIFNQQKIYHDPTVYINITSKMNPNDAPTGHENWFTMINVPNNQGQDWNQLIEVARKNIIDKISKMLRKDIKIVTEEILDPRTIESKTSSALGALYGNSSNNLFAAFLRHANVSRRVKGLYFCGGSVHPGGGIPMALSSAKIVSKYFK